MIIKAFLVGIVNSLIGLVIIFTGKFFGLNDIYSNAIGYSGGLSVSFILNKNWTFRASKKWKKQLIPFLSVTFFAYICNLTVVIFTIKLLNINGYIGQTFGVPIYFILSYFGYKKYVFT